MVDRKSGPAVFDRSVTDAYSADVAVAHSNRAAARPENPAIPSMAVIVDFLLMAGVRVIMRSMIARVIVRVAGHISRMIVGMLVLVNMVVGMGMGMFMGMLRAVVGMLVGMRVGVFVRVHVGVFVIALHGVPPLLVG